MADSTNVEASTAAPPKPAPPAGEKKKEKKKYNFRTLRVTSPAVNVLHVEISREKKLNAMNSRFWREIKDCFEEIAVDNGVRCVVISGAGPMFSAGIDLEDLMAMATKVEGGEKLDVARRAYRLRNIVENLQDAFTAIERTPQPVIAAVHSGCIGGGVDLVCACDIRICSQDAYFQVKEVDVGITADVGTLQRLPKILGSESLVRELCYTARKLKAPEAMACGFVSRVYPSYDALLEGAFRLAHVIAGKSPIAVAGTKEMLTYARDHSVDDGLRLVRTWNMAMVQSQDIGEALAARAAKRSPIFAKL